LIVKEFYIVKNVFEFHSSNNLEKSITLSTKI